MGTRHNLPRRIILTGRGVATTNWHRSMKRFLLAAAVMLGACGGSADTPATPALTGPGTSSGSFSVSLDGSPWSASKGLLATYANPLFGITGSDGVRSIQLAFSATATGTFTLTSVLISNNLGQCWTNFAGPTQATVSLTTFTSDHAVGTFAFDALAFCDFTTGAIHATGGKFDVRF